MNALTINGRRVLYPPAAANGRWAIVSPTGDVVSTHWSVESAESGGTSLRAHNERHGHPAEFTVERVTERNGYVYSEP